MAVYFVGGEADTFMPVSGQTYAWSSTGGRFEANASRGAMQIDKGVSEIEAFFSANQTEAWMHMYLYYEDPAAEANFIVFKTLAGADAYRIEQEAGGEWTIAKWDGGTWVDLDTSAAAVLSNAAAAIDIHILRHASTGIFRVYKDGVVVCEFLGDTETDEANFGRIRWGGHATELLFVSQVAASDEAMIGWKVATMHATGNGANTAMDGDFNDIDEAALNVADFIEADATNEIETFTNQDLNVAYAAYNVKAVGVGIHASNDSASAVNDLQAALRVGGSNFFSANVSLPKDGTNYSRQAIFLTNPNTSNPWSQAEANGAEFGVKSV